MADTQSPTKDPIVHGSLSLPLFVAAVGLGLALLWAFYDESIAKRPWIGYQSDFVERYTDHLEGLKTDITAFEGGLQDDEEVQALRASLEAARSAAAGEIAAIDKRSAELVNPAVARLTKAMQAVRSEVMALTYRLEHAKDKDREKLETELEEVKQREFTIPNLVMPDGTPRTEPFNYASLAQALDAAKLTKAELIQERATLGRPARDISLALRKLIDRKRPGLSAAQVDGLISKMDNFRVGIRQIHVPDPIGLVDRCETCHLGIREPVTLTPEDIGGSHAQAFTSHPNKELLQIHDPEQFGCTPCHGGNGAATISVKEGHGKIKHWLWPLYDQENTEAGCLQCHESSLVLEHAETLNAGKELFRHRGCWGCHPREGFDTERSQRRIALQASNTVKDTIERTRWAIEEQYAIADSPDSTDAEVAEALALIPEYTLRISGLESELIELDRRAEALGKQLKNVGPSLRPVRQKLKPEWITQWIANPREFRPTTRMPVFRLPPEHLTAIAAAVWQSADEPDDLPTHPRGDQGRGKALFESRGCLACHAIEKNADGEWIGGAFGPELSRIGEKANYDYVVDWIRDTPDWSLMPDLRLSPDEANDIATYLMNHKVDGATYDTNIAHLSDPNLFEEGKKLIRHYGCAGCHDMRGFETVGKIGTELTDEGNKPIERLDFALHTYDAKRNKSSEGIQYNHKSFFEYKLKQPEFFDEGKLIENPLDRSRMPNFGLDDREVIQLVTFMLGSVDSDVPEQLYNKPTGKEKDIVDGWWVIKKYNCMGCHQITPNHVPEIQKLPQYAGENAALAPPSLVGVGARLNPEWLAKFLRNPAMSDDERHRNGVRSYLAIRMPTFNLWDEEIGALVRFFEAMSDQTTPYFPPHYPELTESERTLAREAFLSMDCLNCHASAEQVEFDPSVIAPSFVHAQSRLKPLWTERWLLDPGKLMIGTRMPAGLFRPQDGRSIVAGQMTDDLAAYDADHAKLFVRYMNTIDVREANLLKQIKDAEKAAAPAAEEEFLEDEEEEIFEEEDE